MKGLWSHLVLTLRLNFRSKMPVIYGYLVPVFFLVGFAAVFRGANPPVIGQLGQLLTITALGGACFGMPTAMVSERERGIWRRYRLLPAATGALVVSTMAARLVLLVSSALLQIILAIWIYKMPLPAFPVQMAVAFGVVAFSFIGMGLVIAMLAETVPAVQALGQAIFLPMILIGGVGVPLGALPHWAQVLAGFMPGRYAVEAINACANSASRGLGSAIFSLVALVIIGIAACAAGSNMFRWDAGQKLAPRAKWWVIVALGAWGMVGVAAEVGGRQDLGMNARALGGAGFETVTDAQINSITFDDLADDNGVVTPLISSPDDISPPIRQWMADFAGKLDGWPPGGETDLVQRTRNLLSLAAVADLAEYPYEGEVPYVVFERLKSQIQPGDLKKILADIILHPGEGSVRTSAEELGIVGEEPEAQVRDRTTQYAKKLLGRLVGKLGS